MELPPPLTNSLTPAQARAVASRGNVLVMAGAGTGKTKTLVDRCLDCLERERVSLDELLVVTFTEAAAAEMRQRLRKKLEEKAAAQPGDDHWPRQLALFEIAHLGTLHSFCLRLVREHFFELGLDPQFAILDEGEARQRANDTLDELFHAHYEGKTSSSAAVQELIQIHGGGRDENIRKLVLRMHHYSQARADAAGWLQTQVEIFSQPEPTDWQAWLLAAVTDWRAEWSAIFGNLTASNEKAAELAKILARLTPNFARELAAEVLDQIVSSDGVWPAKRKTILRQPLGDIFDEAAFLLSLATVKNGTDPLAEDWTWVRGHMATLLSLAQEFAAAFAENKRRDGVVDFHDLEQFALRVLQEFSGAEKWHQKLRFVFVDEYQDINAAQDQIIAALSGTGDQANRFLVGDIKQSIYRFRLADPKIFRDYSHNWHGSAGETISLSENFRSCESLLVFTNSVCRLVLREEVGGVGYAPDAELKFGAPAARKIFGTAQDTAPRVELLLRHKASRHQADDGEADGLADLDDAQREARVVARQLQQLVTEQSPIWDELYKIFRPVMWRDVAILLRSPRAKSEIYVKEFERAGIPLAVARGGFYDSAEILDLLSLLRLLDNPQQDVPCIAVLRSPLVGLSLDELAEIRLAAREKHFWTALVRSQQPESSIQNSATAKVANFLERFGRWRHMAKHRSLSECLEAVLAETLYADWLRAQPRGAQRAANVAAFAQLAQSFDQFQRQGLFRFLKFIEAQQATETEPEVAATATENAVRLMSIHQSKGLEFPIVVLADLAKSFNEQDLRAEIIFDEEYGLCPKVKPPTSGRRYPSLPHWLAQRRQQRELRGEELRLLYVALTRARDRLILVASVTEKKWDEVWTQPAPVTPQKIADAKSFADWLALWFAQNIGSPNAERGETAVLRWRLVNDAELVDATAESVAFAKTTEPETSAWDETALAHLREILSWEYPQPAATTHKAKSSVSELRRAAEELDDEAASILSAPWRANRQAEGSARKLDAAATGIAHHKFLQHIALENASDVAAEAARLVREHFLTVEEAAALDLVALAQFWDSSLGQKIRQHAQAVRRELPFTARFSAAEAAQIMGQTVQLGLENEFLVVQGVADLVVLLPEEIWLLDFKTDAVAASELAVKIKIYTPQLQFYAAALHKIFARRVTQCALHFFALQRTEPISLT